MISVIGYKGIVGNATYQLFKNLGFKVCGSDVGDPLVKSDMYFICVPEACVEEVVRKLPEGLIVIRSTVPPLTTEYLSEKYNRHICHNPEFLHQAIALIDAHNPDSIVIGECCPEHGQQIEELYKPLCRPIVRTTSSVSEIVKLARNNYGATIISFWNEIGQICKRIGVNPYHVGMICSYDPIISDKGSRLLGKYGGACLPKDIKQMTTFAMVYGVGTPILDAVREVNDITE